MFTTSYRVRKIKNDCILLTSTELGEEGVLIKATFVKESNKHLEPNFLLGMHG